MSRYLRDRRRYSEQDAQEKPPARFQWRMRVNSLMLDDESQVYPLGDRRGHDRARKEENNSEKAQCENSVEHKATEDTFKEKRSLLSRRNRFSRTASEGILTYRVRLSKFEGRSESFDESEAPRKVASSCVMLGYDNVSTSREQAMDTTEKFQDVTDKHNTLLPLSDPELAHTHNESSVSTKKGHANEAASRSPTIADDSTQHLSTTSIPKWIEPFTSESSAERAPSNDHQGDTHEPEAKACMESLHANSQPCLGTGSHFFGVGAIPKQPNPMKPVPSCLSQGEITDTPKVSEEVHEHDGKDDFYLDMEKENTVALHTSQPLKVSNVPGAMFFNNSENRNAELYENSHDNRRIVFRETDSLQISGRPGALFFSGGAENVLENVTSDTMQETKEELKDIHTKPEQSIDENEDFSREQYDQQAESLPTEDDANRRNFSLRDILEELASRGDPEFRNAPSVMTDEDKKYLKHQMEACLQEEQDLINRASKVSSDWKYRGTTSSGPPSSDTQVALFRRPKDEEEEEEPSKEENEGSDRQRGVIAFSREESEHNSWSDLPFVLLEDVYTLLTPKERHYASQVCRQWYDLFYSPRVWETFILLERTLTKKRFNLYKGYQRELCPGKTQLCFRRVGSFFKRIVVTPISDYFNLYEFLRILAAFLQHQEEHGLTGMPLLHTFDLTFACASRGDGGMLVHGTGGQILSMIEQLLVRMSNLKHLKLNQLMIDVMDIHGLFNAISECFGESLNTLEIVNLTKIPVALEHLAQFRNLIKLTVSPQHINEEVLILLAGLNLLQLHLLQDRFTCDCQAVQYEAWKLLKEMAPWMKVYLELCGDTKSQLLIQPRAPVFGIFLRTPYSRLDNDLAMSVVEHYSKTLKYFVQERLPRVHGPRGFHGRCDSSLLFLVRRCTSLHTLVVRERISTCTLILLAHEGKQLSTLLVRQHALIKRCDWPKRGEWSREFYSRLQAASLDYAKCTDEICKYMQRRWKALTDKQFMRLKMVPRREAY